MKGFSRFFTEAASKSNAVLQATRMGLTTDGHGGWYDKSGEFVAKTEGGKLKFYNKGQKPGKDTPGEQSAKNPAAIEDKKRKDDQLFGAPNQQQAQQSVSNQQQSEPQVPRATRADGSPKEDRGTLTVAFGRFNPPHAGHQKVFDAARKAAGKGGGLRIYPSRSSGKKTDPLDVDSKHEYLSKMFPDHAANIVNDPNKKTIFDVLKQAYDDGYSSVKIVAGGKRVKEFDKLANDYNGKLYDFSKIETISAGDRDEEKKGGVEGASASKLRKAAEEDRFKSTYYPKGHEKAGEIEHEGFEEYLPKAFREDEKLAKQLFNTVKQQLKGLKKKEKAGVKEGLWQIAPKLDWKNLRENYISGTIFKVDQLVENLHTGLIGKIIRRGTNYLICVTKENVMFKSWITDLTEYNEVKMDSIDREPGKPNTLVGTTGYLKYAMKMTGTKDIKNFINKYKKKSS